jgi:hypothetical protein
MQSRIIGSAAWICVVTLASIASGGTIKHFYVAPDGDDARSGSRWRPFATFERAQEAVKAYKDAVPATPVDLIEVLSKGAHIRSVMRLSSNPHTAARKPTPSSTGRATRSTRRSSPAGKSSPAGPSNRTASGHRISRPSRPEPGIFRNSSSTGHAAFARAYPNRGILRPSTTSTSPTRRSPAFPMRITISTPHGPIYPTSNFMCFTSGRPPGCARAPSTPSARP